MPTYDFKDRATGNVFTQTMRIAEKEIFLSENPNIEQLILRAPAIGDPVRLGVRKVDGGFKEVLQKIHSRAPGSDLNTIADI